MSISTEARRPARANLASATPPKLPSLPTIKESGRPTREDKAREKSSCTFQPENSAGKFAERSITP